jgi:hypothetical protein
VLSCCSRDKNACLDWGVTQEPGEAVPGSLGLGVMVDLHLIAFVKLVLFVGVASRLELDRELADRVGGDAVFGFLDGADKIKVSVVFALALALSFCFRLGLARGHSGRWWAIASGSFFVTEAVKDEAVEAVERVSVRPRRLEDGGIQPAKTRSVECV